ncbi:MAG: hypothetical protein QNK03_11060 [Myxococcota bacterium]|nr:hypothetical protein [Myxococcota bacterium]
MKSCARSILAGCLVLLVAAVHAAPAAADSHAAERPEWDQARVTELAKELAQTVRDIRSQVQRTVSGNLATMQAHNRHNVIDNLRLIRNETRHLANELEAGKGYEETLPIARRIDTLIDRAARQMRTIGLTEPVLTRIEKADQIIEQIRPFYMGFPAEGEEFPPNVRPTGSQ